MTGELIADRRATALTPDRDYELRTKFDALDDPFAARLLAESVAGWAETGLAEEYGDPKTGLARAAMQEIALAVDRLGIDPEGRMRDLRACMTLHADMSVNTEEYSDGSGLVTVSDGATHFVSMVGMEIGLAIYQTINRPVLFSELRAAFRVTFQKRLGYDFSDFGHLLRCTNIHRRLDAGAPSAYRVDAISAPSLAIQVTFAGELFMFAHEVAHYLLGHARDNAHERQTGDLSVEIAADQLAYTLTRKVLDEVLGEDRQCANDMVAALGGLAVILAISNYERAMLVRRGSTHPGVMVRLRSLVQSVTPSASNFIASAFNDSNDVLVDASDFSSGASVFDAGRFKHMPFDPAKLERTLELDRILTADNAILRGLLDNNPIPAGIPEFTRHLGVGDIHKALLALGVSRIHADDVAFSKNALAFIDLRTWILDGLKSSLIPERHLEPVSIAAAVLISRSIKWD